jgi:hypothetical protein
MRNHGRALRDLMFGLAAFTAIFTARNAIACGASTGGVAGLSACSVDEHEEEIRAKWRIGESFSYTSTGIRFDDVRPDETRVANVLTLETMPFPRLAIQLGAGVIDNQVLVTPGARYNTPDGGVVMVLGGSYRLLDPDGVRPFVLATVGLTMSAVQTQIETAAATRALYSAFDARGGFAVGWSIAHVLSPYLLGRVFGGPVYWRYQNEKETGTDVHHFQVGGGVSLALRNGFDLFVEGVPLGELGLSGGAGFSF